jgi:hypothetical protein
MRALLPAYASFVAVLGFAATVRAQTSEPPTTPTVTPEAQEAVDRWRTQYDLARQRLLAGDFAFAASEFGQLAQDPVVSDNDRALAATLRDLARSWQGRGLTLVNRNDLGESSLPARAVNERTTDEIAQLYAGALLYGIGTGVWLDVHTSPSSAAGVILPMIGFSAASIGGVALLDVNHPLKYGVAQSTVSGLYLGLEEGFLLTFWNGQQATATYGTGWGPTTSVDVMWALSTVGAVGGGLLGNAVGTTPGRASFVGSAGLWGATFTGLAALALNPNDKGGANALLAADVGLNVGIIGGLLAAGPVSPSIARTRFLDLGALGGGLLLGGLYTAAANNSFNPAALSGMTALGIAGGLGFVWWATSGMPADRPEEREKQKTETFFVQPSVVPVPHGATLGVQGIL